MRMSIQTREVLSHIIRSGYKIDLVRHPEAWSAHIFHPQIQGISSEDIYGGTAKVKEIAISKAVSEFVERQAFYEKSRTDVISDSTGFSARPRSSRISLAKTKTKWSSKLEAMERYYAFHWWEDHSVSHAIRVIDTINFNLFIGLGIKDKFKKAFLIQVGTPGFEDVLVLIGMLPYQGFAVGCAAGWAWERDQTLFRACVELMRHYHIIEKLTSSNDEPSSLYTKKLLHLASGSLDQDLLDRLESKGNKKCRKPRAIIDEEVPHQFSKLYYVHRFCFEDQPDILNQWNNIII
ncbi:MAG: hypothetical protein ACK52I_32195 [Pseudomonadota bacterium]|jgi:hypothetical protein